MGDTVEDASASVTRTPQVTQVVDSSVATVMLDSSHPVYLHLSDSPRMVLVSSIFYGKGYGGWRRGILIALSAKNKLGFISGSFPQPKISSDSFKPWTRCNDMVISWVLNSLSKEIAESVLYSKTARDIWTELEERFGQSNGPQLYLSTAKGNLRVSPSKPGHCRILYQAETTLG